MTAPVLHASPDAAYLSRLRRDLHAARRANDRAEVADVLDDIDLLALYADCPRVKWLARRLVLAGAAETKKAAPGGAAC